MYTIEIRNYDTTNSIIDCYYINYSGEKDTTDRGDASYKRFFDVNDNQTKLEIYDLEGKLFESWQNTAIYKYEYDDRGNKIKASYFTADNKPSPANKGAHINDYVYSEDNRMIERSYRDTANNLIEYDGYARIKWKYDSAGNKIETKYYNKYDNLVDSGVAVVRNKFDKNKNVIEEKEFDNLNNGIVMKKHEWDEHGNIIASSFYSINGLKTVDKDSIHKYEYEYKNGIYYGDSYYDTLGNLVELDNVAYSELELDSRGNIERKTTYDQYGNLAIRKGKEYAIVEYEYDDYDRIISEDYYDDNNEPAKVEGKYSTVRYKLDKSGNILFKAFFDANGNLTTNEEEVAVYKREYNRNSVAIVSNDLNLEEAQKIVVLFK